MWNPTRIYLLSSCLQNYDMQDLGCLRQLSLFSLATTAKNQKLYENKMKFIKVNIHWDATVKKKQKKNKSDLKASLGVQREKLA